MKLSSSHAYIDYLLKNEERGICVFLLRFERREEEETEYMYVLNNRGDSPSLREINFESVCATN